MKIAIPMDEKGLDSPVCASFGRAPYFLIYSTATNEEEYLDNAAVASQGGAGVRAAQVIVDRGVKALLTPRCGENAEKVLRAGEVLVYRSKEGSARANIEAFAAESLPLLTAFHAGLHGHN